MHRALRVYGPIVAVGAIVIGGIALLPDTDGGDEPVVSDAAADARGVDDGVRFGQGPNCRADGRQAGISVYMPPCADWEPGTDNGGATARGVSENEIVVAWYRTGFDESTAGALNDLGFEADGDAEGQQMAALARYANLHYETYGREVKIVPVGASGDDTESQKADALRIAEELGAFAVIGAESSSMVAELAQRGVVCLCLDDNVSRAVFEDNPPVIFPSDPPIEVHLAHLAEYLAARLSGEPAAFGGDDVRERERRFGLVFDEAPELVDAVAGFERTVEDGGDEIAVTVGFSGETSTYGDQAAAIVSRMRAESVTSVVYFGDPLMPQSLTAEATRQDWYPEWIVTGTFLSDTTFFGRSYDQAQWQHAFGIAVNGVFWERVEASPGAREVAHVSDVTPELDVNTARKDLERLFIGIHMAGPALTPSTFAEGLYAYPRTGGTAAHPLRYFTEAEPWADHDFTEIFWDPDRAGLDEVGTDGRGAMMRAGGGARYALGSWPSEPPDFADGAVFTADAPPGGRDADHEQDGHVHTDDRPCLSCG